MDSIKKLAKLVAGLISSKEKKTKPYDTTATVKRVVGDTAYVHIPGGVPETPVKITAAVEVGDIVPVRMANGTAWSYGNVTHPPTDDTKAIAAEVIAQIADKSAATAHEKADDAEDKAVDAKETAEAILVYDHTYEFVYDESTPPQPIGARFTAYLYQGGVDIKSKCDEQLFTWALKTEAGETDLGYGYEITIDLADCDYGAEVIGRFTEGDSAVLQDNDGNNYTTASGQEITARADGDHVKVRDLEVRTSISDIEKLMIVGTVDEHLVTMDTLVTYLTGRINSDKHFVYTQATPSATWEIEHNLGKAPSVTVVDSAGTAVEGDCEYVNENKVILSFSSAFSGKAYLN